MTLEQYQAISENPKAFLERGKKLGVHIDTRIRAKWERIDSWRALAESTTVTLQNDGGRGPSGYKQSLVENAVCNILALENEIKADLAELGAALNDTKIGIGELATGPSQKAVLELRYLNGFSWSVVAEKLGCSERWVYRLHSDALSVMQEGAKSAMARI